MWNYRTISISLCRILTQKPHEDLDLVSRGRGGEGREGKSEGEGDRMKTRTIEREGGMNEEQE